MTNPSVILQQTQEEIEGDIKQYSVAIFGIEKDIEKLNLEISQCVKIVREMN